MQGITASITTKTPNTCKPTLQIPLARFTHPRALGQAWAQQRLSALPSDPLAPPGPVSCAIPGAGGAVLSSARAQMRAQGPQEPGQGQSLPCCTAPSLSSLLHSFTSISQSWWGAGGLSTTNKHPEKRSPLPSLVLCCWERLQLGVGHAWQGLALHRSLFSKYYS